MMAMYRGRTRHRSGATMEMLLDNPIPNNKKKLYSYKVIQGDKVACIGDMSIRYSDGNNYSGRIADEHHTDNFRLVQFNKEVIIYLDNGELDGPPFAVLRNVNE